MKSSCISHPKNEPLIIIRQQHLNICNNNWEAALIMSLMELCKINRIEAKAPMSLREITESSLGLASRRTIKRGLDFLIKQGYIESIKVSGESAAFTISQKSSLQKLPLWGKYYCEWCGCKTVTLQNHHYPITRKDGGKDVIKICAGCHSEFHYLTGTLFYSPTKKLLNLFEKHPLNEAIEAYPGGIM